MLIGNGLIAQEFAAWRDREDVLICAAGVSNSREQDPAAYQREAEMVASHADTAALFVYFSTCSIHDPALQAGPYIQHKLEMEAYIKSHFTSYLIVRLPNLIGLGGNPQTFFNFFYDAIRRGDTVYLQTDAVRYFLDVADVEPVLSYLIDQANMCNETLDIALDNALSVPEAVALMERLMQQKLTRQWVEGGTAYQLPTEPFMKLQQAVLGVEDTQAYTEKCFAKYIALRQAKVDKFS